MKSVGEASTVLFLHIPKAGGSTLRNIIGSQFGSDSVCRFSNPNRPAGSAEFREFLTVGNRCKVIQGHFCYGIHTQLEVPYSYLTMLRDPVERVLSFYHYLKRRPKQQVVAGFIEKMDILEFITSGAFMQVNNGQTRQVAGEWAFDVPFGRCGEDMLEQAKRNLHDGFKVVGTMERFDEMLLLLCHEFGWNNNPYYRKANVTKGRTGRMDILPKTLDVIEEYNQLDIRLHAYANALMDEQIGSIPGFKERVWRFKRRNMLYGYYDRTKSQLERLLRRSG